MDRKRLFSILLVVFIDLLGFSLILPLLPYYAETFNASKFVTGLLIAVYALMQLIGAPILGGALLEKVGTWSPGAFGAVVMTGVTIYVVTKILNHPIVISLQDQESTPVPVVVSD